MSYNPTLALNSINPSLVGYTGGIGKAMQAMGGSMSSIGQAKLDLEEKQALKDEKTKAALDLRNGNISTNRLIAKTYGNDTIFSDDEMAQYKPEQFRALGKDGFDMLSKKKEADVATAQKGALIDQIMKDKPSLFLGKTRDEMMALDFNEYLKTKETQGAPMFTNNGGVVKRDKFGTISDMVVPTVGLYLPEATKTETTFSANGTPGVTKTNILTGKSETIAMPSGTKTEGQKGREESLANSLTTISAGGKETRKNQAYGNALSDGDVKQHPKLKIEGEQEIGAQGAIDNGGLPITLDANPQVRELQKKYAMPVGGGAYVVPQADIAEYTKRFPQLKR